ncbi:Prolyl oligopeptidase family protein [Pustulibacterium marinum]|uniref:Prolyl oligopeptidase family protein n=1 Tax=Pustulibacterium marinum TaxID=1224947 RepID=A0A1I7IZ69_9FLAO|nr:Prolyl oligopeptidase family protein [Pustulibacterium marinum]
MYKSSFFKLILGLSLLAGLELAAQRSAKEWRSFVNRFETISQPQMSANARWLSLHSSYANGVDSVWVFDSHRAKEVIGVRTAVRHERFVGKEHLVLQQGTQVELWNLRTDAHRYLQGVANLWTVEQGTHFWMGYNASGGLQTLESRSEVGDIKGTLHHVFRVLKVMEDTLYAVQYIQDTYRVVAWEAGNAKVLYTSPFPIVDMSVSEHGVQVLLYEQVPEQRALQPVFVDTKRKLTKSLADLLAVSKEAHLHLEELEAGTSYLVRMRTKVAHEQASVAQIWYGDEPNLERQFYPEDSLAYYVWEPKAAILKSIVGPAGSKFSGLHSDRWLLCSETLWEQDTLGHRPVRLSRYDWVNQQRKLIDTVYQDTYLVGKGAYLLYPMKKQWRLYEVGTGKKEVLQVEGARLQRPYASADGTAIWFGSDAGIWKYGLASKQWEQLEHSEVFQTRIVSGNRMYGGYPQGIHRYEVAADKMVWELKDSLGNRSWRYGTYGRRLTNSSGKYRDFVGLSKDTKTVVYLEEDYNQAPKLCVQTSGKAPKMLYQSNPFDTGIQLLQQERIHYTNSDGIPLQGVLYYPIGYEANRKYPMVVHIYQVQHEQTNRYPMPAFGQRNNDAFPLRLLLESGYFVYLPDIVYGDAGTGLSALDCVHWGLDALGKRLDIDWEHLGLLGHSHGGYETNFIATHSNRFAAYCSGAGNSDLVRSYFSFNDNFKRPFYYQFEDGQYEMPTSFVKDPQLYIDNSPVYHVANVQAPILLWTGQQDQNIYWEQTMEFYIALRRYGKKVLMVLYPDEKHTIYQPKASEDLTMRVLEWFGYYLKGDKSMDWIDKE